MSVTSVASYRLSEEQRSYAVTCLNEEDGVRDEKIKEVRRWLFNGGGICTCVVYTNDDFFIIRFLRCCKFDVDTTKQKIKNYFSQRENLPEWYGNKNPFLPELQELFDLGLFLPLSKLDSEGCTVIIVRPCLYDPNRQKIADVLKVCLMILDVAMRSNVSASLYGVKAIIDLEGATMGHVLQLPPHVLKQLVHAWQACYPLRIKSLHFVNPPTFFNVVFNIIRSFMVKKLRDRTHIHSKCDGLTDNIDPNILPPAYTGTGESVETLKDHWKKMAETNASWLAEEEAKDVLWSEQSKKECLNCEKL